MADPNQPEPPPGQGDWLSQLRQSYSQVQLGPGIVGKTSRAMLGLMAAWGLVILRLGSDALLNGCLLVAGVAVTLAYYWWVKKTHAFAEKFPQVALLEGAQLIEYQKWQAEINGKVLPQSLPVPDPESVIKIEMLK